jgi:rhodanese-related sulfurtransferase
MILTLTICAEALASEVINITQEEARQIMATNPDALIVDVRTPEEYTQKHIAGAILVPLDDLQAGNFVSLPDKDAALLIYCRSGRRSKVAANILVANGYTAVYEFGGINDWTGAVVE